MRIDNKPYNKSTYPLLETNSNTKYVVSKTELDEFITHIQEDTFLENIKMLFDNASEYINNILVFPFNVNTQSITGVKTTYHANLKIGNISITGVDNYEITGYQKTFIRVGSIYFDRTNTTYWTNDYLDYLTTISMWLPYYSFVDIPVSDVLGKTLYIDYQIDYDTGVCSIYLTISSTNDENDAYLYRTYETQIASVIPVGYTNANEKLKNIVSSGIKLMGSYSSVVASSTVTSFQPAYYLNNKKNAKGAYSKARTYNKVTKGLSGNEGSMLANGGMEMINAMQNKVVRGELNNIRGFYSLPQNIFFIYTRPNPMNLPDFPSFVGRACYQTLQLKDLTGYTVVGEIHLTNFAEATKQELDEIETLLKGGVIL